jgi:hypothetical protein
MLPNTYGLYRSAIILAYVQILLDFGAICFKFHDRINRWPISFQSTIPKSRKAISVSTHHDDLWSFAQLAISIPDRRKELTFDRTHDQRTDVYKSTKGSRLMSLIISYTFYTRSAVYKSVRRSWLMSLTISYTFTRASPHTKSKGLLIDAPYRFYYFQHAHWHVQKARGSWSTLHTNSTTFSTCITAYKK